MTPTTLRLVLLVSCAHALVHVYELSFPSVELLVAKQYHVTKEVTGALGSCWRVPFGLGAMLAGWLVDRYGAKWLLTVYLLGCAGMSAVVWTGPSLNMLFGVMFTMGAFASIYHPAGLALISHETRPENRPMALGLHGMLGSLGIASAPLLAGVVLDYSDNNWQLYYLCLVIPGVVLAVVIATSLTEHHRQAVRTGDALPPSDDESTGHWRAFFLLTLAGTLNGFVYAALMNFLPRYLEGRNLLAGAVLLVGILGQFTAGKVARHGALERQLATIMFTMVPLLLAMAFAEGAARFVAAGAVMFVQFMHQPVYNSLLATYVPRHRRSLGFGFSNTVAFGIGGLGAWVAGQTYNDHIIYSGLAGVVMLSALVVVGLARLRRRFLLAP